MKIGFYGAARTVTGSKHLLTLSNGTQILLDCGMFQGMGTQTSALNTSFGFDPKKVNILLLSHAHVDHCGLIPKLVKEGFRGKIYATPATRALCGIMLEDSARIQEEDAKFLNKRRAREGKNMVEPLYTLEDALLALDLFEEKEYNTSFHITPEVEVLFTDAGHIIGSAAVHMTVVENGQTTRITFSGDVGRYRDVILRSPQEFPQADYIILESTYGSSSHELEVSTPDHLLEWITKTCLEKKGKLIIPAFSLGRTQELLFALNQLELENRLPELDYFVDSPMSVKVTELIKKYPGYFNKNIQRILEHDEDPFKFKGLNYVRTVEESKMLNFRNKPCVIISASGMAEAGRVKHHISNNIENSRNAILIVGYCEPGSLGGRLMAGQKEVGIFGTQHQVNAEIGIMRSLSAHGDYEDLSQFIANQDPRKVKKLFLVHGEYPVQQEFKARLLKKGFWDVQIPEQQEVIGLG